MPNKKSKSFILESLPPPTVPAGYWLFLAPIRDLGYVFEAMAIMINSALST
jgi:hypothetical protein